MNLGKSQSHAFQAAKIVLQVSSLLVHYDSERQQVLACNASTYWLGAMLSHILEKRTECPVAFTSRTLTAAEKKKS